MYEYDEAIELTGNGKIQTISFILFGICLMYGMSEMSIMAYVLPTAKCDLNITLQLQGLINSVTFIGIVLTSHMWGFLADTWGRKKVLLTSTFGSFIFAAFSSFAMSAYMLFASRLDSGLL